ncbi:hypothetical protein ACLOJK_039634 [Asimina triloba]
MATPITNLNASSEILLAKTKIFDVKRPRTSSSVIRSMKAQGNEEAQEQASQSIDFSSTQTTRRAAAIGLGFLAVSSSFSSQTALAADVWNGLWLTGPLPIPSVDNKIANEKTGTRSFLKKGIYVANIGVKGSQYRLRSYAFDLLALEDLMGKNAWNYFRQYLRQKSSVMYYDFDKVISAAPESEKQSLMDLANKLFDNVEKLEDAARKRDEPQIISYYEDTKALLKEVRTRMA